VNGQTYYARISAVDLSGNEGGYAQASWSVDTVAPTAPTGVTDSTKNYFTLTTSPYNYWTASTDTVSGVKQYLIRAATGSGSITGLPTMTASTSYQGTGLSLSSATLYKIEVAAEDNAGNISAYAASDGWTAYNCPTNYAWVQKLSTTSTAISSLSGDFCIAKFEMKNNGSGGAVSQAASLPYVNISQADSKTKCTNIGTGYKLASNAHWQATAYMIERNQSNWSSNFWGSGMINRGHSDNAPNSIQAVSDTNNPYSDTGNTSGQVPGGGWEQKRTHTLFGSDEVIWDFAGNAWEWADTIENTSYGVYSFSKDLTGAARIQYGPLDGTDATYVWPYHSPTDNYGLGAGYLQNIPVGGAAVLRSGHFASNGLTGIYTAWTDKANTVTGGNIGFRCVYDP
jgi:hypothetical protein